MVIAELNEKQRPRKKAKDNERRNSWITESEGNLMVSAQVLKYPY